VYFFSLDAANYPAVLTARTLFRLNYRHARMSVIEKDGWIDYASERTETRFGPARFQARYQPKGDVYHAAPGSLEHWLTERYCMFPIDPAGRVYRGDVHHVPYPLQPARAEIEANTMLEPVGLKLPDTAPLLHFVRQIKVVVWRIQRLDPPWLDPP
jgi:uncharacterized protein YqjF (DUF2071 family)